MRTAYHPGAQYVLNLYLLNTFNYSIYTHIQCMYCTCECTHVHNTEPGGALDITKCRPTPVHYICIAKTRILYNETR